MQVQFAATDRRLLARLHVHPAQRYRAVRLVLDTVQETLVASLLSRPQRVVVDLEVVGEEVRALRSSLAVDKLVD